MLRSISATAAIREASLHHAIICPTPLATQIRALSKRPDGIESKPTASTTAAQMVADLEVEKAIAQWNIEVKVDDVPPVLPQDAPSVSVMPADTQSKRRAKFSIDTDEHPVGFFFRRVVNKSISLYEQMTRIKTHEELAQQWNLPLYSKEPMYRFVRVKDVKDIQQAIDDGVLERNYSGEYNPDANQCMVRFIKHNENSNCFSGTASLIHSINFALYPSGAKENKEKEKIYQDVIEQLRLGKKFTPDMLGRFKIKDGCILLLRALESHDTLKRCYANTLYALQDPECALNPHAHENEVIGSGDQSELFVAAIHIEDAFKHLAGQEVECILSNQKFSANELKLQLGLTDNYSLDDNEDDAPSAPRFV